MARAANCIQLPKQEEEGKYSHTVDNEVHCVRALLLFVAPNQQELTSVKPTDYRRRPHDGLSQQPTASVSPRSRGLLLTQNLLFHPQTRNYLIQLSQPYLDERADGQTDRHTHTHTHSRPTVAYPTTSYSNFMLLYYTVGDTK